MSERRHAPVDVPIALAGGAATKALTAATAIPLVFAGAGGPLTRVKTVGEIQYDFQFFLKKN